LQRAALIALANFMQTIVRLNRTQSQAEYSDQPKHDGVIALLVVKTPGVRVGRKRGRVVNVLPVTDEFRERLKQVLTARRGEAARLARVLSVAPPRITELIRDPDRPDQPRYSRLVAPISAHYGWPILHGSTEADDDLARAVSVLPPLMRDAVLELPNLTNEEQMALLTFVRGLTRGRGGAL